MHGFSGRQLQQEHWREGLAGQLGIKNLPETDDHGKLAELADAERKEVAEATA